MGVDLVDGAKNNENTSIDFAWTLRLEAKTPRALREFVIMRWAQVSGAEYEWAHHWPMALAAGVAEAKLHALKDWPESGLFGDEDRAVLQVADDIAQGPGASEASIARLKELFTPSEVAESVVVANQPNLRPRACS